MKKHALTSVALGLSVLSTALLSSAALAANSQHNGLFQLAEAPHANIQIAAKGASSCGAGSCGTKKAAAPVKKTTKKITKKTTK